MPEPVPDVVGWPAGRRRSGGRGDRTGWTGARSRPGLAAAGIATATATVGRLLATYPAVRTPWFDRG